MTREMSTVTGTSYGTIRHRHILLNYEPSPSALHALLRVEGAERDDTRRQLQRLGFEPAAGPDDASISWRLAVPPSELAKQAARLYEVLGDQVVLDIGASFDDKLPVSARDASWWPGPLLVEVGGTRRCVIFDHAAPSRDLVHAMSAEREDYFANELAPATE